MAVIRVKLAGETLGDVDFENLTLKDAFAIKASSGLTPMTLFQGIEVADPDALQTLVWFVRMKNGNVVDRASIDFKIKDLETEQVDDGQVGIPNPEGTSESGETGTSGS